MADAYFAALSTEEAASEVVKRVESFYEYLFKSGRITLWRRAYQAYYRGVVEGGQLQRSGKQQEYTTVYVNDLRNLLQHLLVMTTQQKPAFEPRATNTDYKSQAQTILANGLLERDLREKRLSRFFKRCVEKTLVFDEGYIVQDWNATLGQPYGVNPDTQQVVKDGDIEYRTYSPWEIVRDYTKRTPYEHQWYSVRVVTNRWDLVAQYPDLRDKILNLPTAHDEDDRFRVGGFYEREDETDQVVLWRFMHDRTPAVPDGRIMLIGSDDLVFIDGPLPYRKLPVYRCAGADQDNSIHGYSIMYDLLPLQEAEDALFSTILTNQAAFGVQSILVPRGHSLRVERVSEGLNVVEYDPKLGEPKPLQLTSTPPEIFNFVELLQRVQETLSGVNSVSRGNPESSLKSGAALALVASQAIQFSSGLQESYADLVEDVGTGAIHMLHDFAKTPRMAAIAGKANRPLLKQFSGDDLSEIDRVQVDMGNAVSRTVAGRMNLAEMFMDKGWVQNPQQAIQVMNTGRLEVTTEGPQAQQLLIKSENEMLAEGQPVQAIAVDPHQWHILEHAAVLASPEARANPQIVGNALQHMQDHINLMRTTDPTLLQLAGSVAAPPAAANEPVPPGAMGQAMDPSAGAPPMPNQPQQPTNPLTGEQAPEPANGPMTDALPGVAQP